jgi:hypothetical protein
MQKIICTGGGAVLGAGAYIASQVANYYVR